MALDRESLARSFVGQLQRVPLGRHYRLGLAGVAVVTVLLPVLYLGAVAAVAYGVYWHAVHDLWLLQRSGLAAKIVGYCGPVVAGVVLLFFMWKPILARPARNRSGITLSPSEAPLL